MGNTIQKHQLRAGYNFIEIQPGDLVHGIYFYTIVSEGQKLETGKTASTGQGISCACMRKLRQDSRGTNKMIQDYSVIPPYPWRESKQRTRLAACAAFRYTKDQASQVNGISCADP